jgi:glycosyltransferase involved in cell wall biosynthesis
MTGERNILQLDKTQSYPPTNGAEKRSWKTAEKLTEFGTLWRVSPWDGYTQLPDGVRLIALTSPVATINALRNDLWYGAFATAERHLVQRYMTNHVVGQVNGTEVTFETIISESPQMIDPSVRLAESHEARLILNKHNCYFDFLDQYLRDKGIPSPIRHRAVENLQRYEQYGIDHADVVVFQSEDDRRRFDIPPSAAVHVVPNGTDYEAIQRPGDPDGLAASLGIAEDRPVCLFIGSFDYEPNAAAARLITRRLAPALPDVTFLLVGRNPPETDAPNVYAPGYVDDLVDALRLADIALCPLPRGSGTKLKMLDYFAAGLPIVTTSVGTQGLPVQDDEHVLVRDDVEGMSRAIRELIEDGTRRRRLGERAHRLGERFAWQRLLSEYDDILSGSE